MRAFPPKCLAVVLLDARAAGRRRDPGEGEDLGASLRVRSGSHRGTRGVDTHQFSNAVGVDDVMVRRWTRACPPSALRPRQHGRRRYGCGTGRRGFSSDQRAQGRPGRRRGFLALCRRRRSFDGGEASHERSDIHAVSSARRDPARALAARLRAASIRAPRWATRLRCRHAGQSSIRRSPPGGVARPVWLGFPFPSTDRRTADGHIKLSDFPNPSTSIALMTELCLGGEAQLTASRQLRRPTSPSSTARSTSLHLPTDSSPPGSRPTARCRLLDVTPPRPTTDCPGRCAGSIATASGNSWSRTASRPGTAGAFPLHEKTTYAFSDDRRRHGRGRHAAAA